MRTWQALLGNACIVYIHPHLNTAEVGGRQSIIVTGNQLLSLAINCRVQSLSYIYMCLNLYACCCLYYSLPCIKLGVFQCLPWTPCVRQGFPQKLHVLISVPDIDCYHCDFLDFQYSGFNSSGVLGCIHTYYCRCVTVEVLHRRTKRYTSTGIWPQDLILVRLEGTRGGLHPNSHRFLSLLRVEYEWMNSMFSMIYVSQSSIQYL